MIINFFLAFLVSLSWSQNFKYSNQDNSGKGKLERITEIEAFLEGMASNIEKLKSNLSKEVLSESQKLNQKIDQIKSGDLKNLSDKLSKIEQDQSEIQKQLKEIKEKIVQSDKMEELKKSNESLTKEVAEIKSTMKSITELMDIYESLQNRGKPINPAPIPDQNQKSN
ncbi:MAG: hypothetical protein Fur0010_03410 [Bdellovibrio sp.]